MNTYTMTPNMKSWLKTAYLETAKSHRSSATNCHLIALGSGNDDATRFEQLADEHRAFAQHLEAAAKELED